MASARPSSFATFLSKPEVQQQYRANANRHFDKHANNIDASYFSRLFNEFPDYKEHAPLIRLLDQADSSVFIESWYKFAYLVAMTELFDSHANIKPDIYTRLNIKTNTHHDKGLLQRLEDAKGPAYVKAHILSAYIVFISFSIPDASLTSSPLAKSFGEDDVDMQKHHVLQKHNQCKQRWSDLINNRFDCDMMQVLWKEAHNAMMDDPLGRQIGSPINRLQYAIMLHIHCHQHCKPALSSILHRATIFGGTSSGSTAAAAATTPTNCLQPRVRDV